MNSFQVVCTVLIHHNIINKKNTHSIDMETDAWRDFKNYQCNSYSKWYNHRLIRFIFRLQPKLELSTPIPCSTYCVNPKTRFAYVYIPNLCILKKHTFIICFVQTFYTFNFFLLWRMFYFYLIFKKVSITVTFNIIVY